MWRAERRPQRVLVGRRSGRLHEHVVQMSIARMKRAVAALPMQRNAPDQMDAGG